MNYNGASERKCFILYRRSLKTRSLFWCCRKKSKLNFNWLLDFSFFFRCGMKNKIFTYFRNLWYFINLHMLGKQLTVEWRKRVSSSGCRLHSLACFIHSAWKECLRSRKKNRNRTYWIIENSICWSGRSVCCLDIVIIKTSKKWSLSALPFKFELLFDMLRSPWCFC